MTIEIRNNKILTQGGKVRQVCDPCVPCTIQPPPDPCDELILPDFLDPSDVDFNPSYVLGTTLSTSVTYAGEPDLLIGDYKEIWIVKYFRVVIDENPTVVINFGLSGSNPFSNLSRINRWGSYWDFSVLQRGAFGGSVQVLLVAGGPVGDSAQRQRNVFTCDDTFNEVIDLTDPADNGLRYNIVNPITEGYTSTTTQTVASNPPVTTTTRLHTRTPAVLNPASIPISNCNTVFVLNYRLWCFSQIYNPSFTGNPPGRCDPYPSSGSANVTGSLTLDIEY
jgi:hypothetical protein